MKGWGSRDRALATVLWVGFDDAGPPGAGRRHAGGLGNHARRRSCPRRLGSRGGLRGRPPFYRREGDRTRTGDGLLVATPVATGRSRSGLSIVGSCQSRERVGTASPLPTTGAKGRTIRCDRSATSAGAGRRGRLLMRGPIVTCPICFNEDDHRWIVRDRDDPFTGGLVGRRCLLCGNEWWFERLGRAS